MAEKNDQLCIIENSLKTNDRKPNTNKDIEPMWSSVLLNDLKPNTNKDIELVWSSVLLNGHIWTS